MQKNLTAALDRIFASEGGFAKRATEPGGAVNRGISFLVFQGWRAAHKLPAPTIDDLKAMTREEAAAIYEAVFLQPCGFAVIAKGTDYAVADWVVNSGFGGHDKAGKLVGALPAIRDVLGFRVTKETDVHPWKMEPDLLWALKYHQPDPTITAICDKRWDLMKANPDFARIAAGRAKRMNDCFNGARVIAGLPATNTRYPR